MTMRSACAAIGRPSVFHAVMLSIPPPTGFFTIKGILQGIAKQENIAALPTVQFWKDGQCVDVRSSRPTTLWHNMQTWPVQICFGGNEPSLTGATLVTACRWPQAACPW